MAALVVKIEDKTQKELSKILATICNFLEGKVEAHIKAIAKNGKDIVAKLATNKVDLTKDAPEACSKWFFKKDENLIEIINQIRHMRAIIGALSVVGKTHQGKITVCHPTQTSGQPSDAKECDLDSPDFVLEAYGGIKYASNGKLSKDLSSLYESIRSRPKGTMRSMYLAYITDSTDQLLPPTFGKYLKEHSNTKPNPKTYNFKYKGEQFYLKIKKKSEMNGVTLLEVEFIKSKK